MRTNLHSSTNPHPPWDPGFTTPGLLCHRTPALLQSLQLSGGPHSQEAVGNLLSKALLTVTPEHMPPAIPPILPTLQAVPARLSEIQRRCGELSAAWHCPRQLLGGKGLSKVFYPNLIYPGRLNSGASEDAQQCCSPETPSATVATPPSLPHSPPTMPQGGKHHPCACNRQQMGAATDAFPDGRSFKELFLLLRCSTKEHLIFCCS